jgi:hypothetical protein
MARQREERKTHLLIGSSMARPTLYGFVVTNIKIDDGSRLLVNEDVAISRLNRHGWGSICQLVLLYVSGVATDVISKLNRTFQVPEYSRKARS